MPAVQIRDLPTEVLAALKRRAARHERSLEGELRHILATIARQEPASSPLPPIELKLSESSAETSWRREDIYGDDGR
jgi:plasmid stability protein